MDSANPQPPSQPILASLGAKFYRYRTLFRRHWWIVVFPSAALAGVAIALHGVGQLLADADSKVEVSVPGDNLAGGEPANSDANSDRILHRA